MEAREVILSILSVAPENKVTGRKRFQKFSHLLQASGEDLGLPFRIHHYGPFCEALSDALKLMSGRGEIRETPIAIGPFETLAYEFSPSGEMGGCTFSPEGRTFLSNLSAYSTSSLEVASTIAFFEGTGLGREAAIDETVWLKPFADDAELQADASSILSTLSALKELREQA